MAHPVALLAGALDRSQIPPTANGLRQLLYGAKFAPIRAEYLHNIEFPVFMAKPFAITDDYGFIINAWAVRDAVENFQVVGGVSADIDKTHGYVKAYQTMLDLILTSDDTSEQAIAVIDHVVTKYLTAQPN